MISTGSGFALVAPDPTNPKMAPGYVPTPAELRPFLLDYFDAQYQLITTHRPEVIGHFDLCLLWTPDLRLDGPEMTGVWEKVKRNIKAVVEYGGLFEANAAALRKGWDTSYPSRAILQVSRSFAALLPPSSIAIPA